MANFTWSLEMMILGMGTVFIMLILLMLLLVSIGRLDARTIKRQQRAGIGAKSEPELLPTSSQSDIPKDKLAAIAVAIVCGSPIAVIRSGRSTGRRSWPRCSGC